MNKESRPSRGRSQSGRDNSRGFSNKRKFHSGHRHPKARTNFKPQNTFTEISLEKYTPEVEAETFEDLKLPKKLIDSLKARGLESPFPIQALSIGVAMEGRDLCGKARTGSGKTIAFGIPVVEKAQVCAPKKPGSLILVPTRELATQVYDEISKLAKYKQLQVGVVFGGVNIEKNIRELRSGIDILIACPGRLEDLMERKAVSLEAIQMLVLDEADQMADMGFLPAVKRITEACPEGGQRLLFSATLDGEINILIKKYLNKPLLVEVENNEVAQLSYQFYLTDYDNKYNVTEDIIRRSNSVIVFCRTRHGVDKLANFLKKANVTVGAIHGGMRVRERQRSLDFFKSGHYRALIATDVAARGIHVDDIETVLHYDMPESVKDFTHRSGRTGRAGKEGKVVGLVTKDKRSLAKMNINTLDPKLDVNVKGFTKDLLEEFLGQQIEIEFKPFPKEKRENSRGGGGRSRGGRSRDGRGRGRSDRYSDRGERSQSKERNSNREDRSERSSNSDNSSKEFGERVESNNRGRTRGGRSGDSTKESSYKRREFKPKNKSHNRQSKD